MRRRLSLLLPALAAVGCGLDRGAGNSTETENVLTAVDFRMDSLLPPGGGVRRPTVVTLRLDASQVDFARTDSSGRDLAVERSDGILLPFRTVFWDRTARRGRLLVRVDTAGLRAGMSLRLAWSRPLRTWDDSAVVWKALPDSQVLSLSSQWVDRFEQGTLRSELPDSGWWYTSASESASVSQPALAAAGHGRGGQALHIGYAAPLTNYRYALAGVSLADGAPRSLRGLDSLVFWARGSGRLSVAFDHLGAGGTGKAWAHRTLDTGWTRIRIRPSDLDTANGIGGNIGWTAVRDSVTHLTFLVAGGSELWLDEIRLHGLVADDLR